MALSTLAHSDVFYNTWQGPIGDWRKSTTRGCCRGGLSPGRLLSHRKSSELNQVSAANPFIHSFVRSFIHSQPRSLLLDRTLKEPQPPAPVHPDVVGQALVSGELRNMPSSVTPRNWGEQMNKKEELEKLGRTSSYVTKHGPPSQRVSSHLER